MGTDSSGDCFEYVLKRIEREIGVPGVRHVRACALDVVTKCVDSYTTAFGSGDVGSGGSGGVSRKFIPTSGEPIAKDTNGLLYGRVQSGKTNVSIASVALAHANGFRCFVVLTSDNTWLGHQTATRFRDQLAHDGPVVKQWEDWHSDPQGHGESLRAYVDDTGVVLVSTKNQAHLQNLVTVLKASRSGRVPAIIIDDEADNASLNTNTAKQARAGDDDDVEPSKIFSLVGEIREAIPNHIFLQVTATPQSLLLQGLDTPMRPSFCVVAPPGGAYVGGDVFFKEGSAHTVNVDPKEIEDLKQNRVNPGDSWDMPEGLRRAVCCFILGAACNEVRSNSTGDGVYSMLVHIDHRRVRHQFVGQTIQKFFAELDQALRGRSSATQQAQAERMLEDAFAELSKTETELPTLVEMRRWIQSRLRNASTQIIDADNPRSEPQYKPGMNVLIGGNRLGRGVTIRGLMVTYYGRDPKTKMMDTVHQHARMFGYRRHLLSVTRVYSAPHLLNAFRAIHEADQGTREAIGSESGELRVKPVWVGPALKPTRANVLNPADVGAIVGGRQIWPPELRTSAADIADSMKTLTQRLAIYSSDEEYYETSIDDLVEILRLTPSDENPAYSWEDGRVREALKAVKASPIGIQTGRVNVNRGRGGTGNRATRDGQLTSGFISGQQQREVRQRFPRQPTLLLRLQQGLEEDGWDGQAFWAPTLILPDVGFVFMFSCAG